MRGVGCERRCGQDQRAEERRRDEAVGDRGDAADRQQPTQLDFYQEECAPTQATGVRPLKRVGDSCI